eukprot:CAMPEP_0172762968 /NCGR_PEP_ID=MMETSP1074-20121228/174480_1 /TAXON_ID=2916 /ORGANISM="Ceratium fusus, Strain PA161109" /LENGTH=61 /DNA_ID=CAMNT_0013597457 /DNA_START=142 /DNA_END=327 /DNA_ORIENTATION=+
MEKEQCMTGNGSHTAAVKSLKGSVWDPETCLTALHTTTAEIDKNSQQRMLGGIYGHMTCRI